MKAYREVEHERDKLKVKLPILTFLLLNRIFGETFLFLSFRRTNQRVVNFFQIQNTDIFKFKNCVSTASSNNVSATVLISGYKHSQCNSYCASYLCAW